ncbi:MAG: gamma-glutamylcyclotransferase [Desulfuromonadales bacterium]|nr:gamma-glutamylcyclotransferase [Desulfuromonadales bacterium]MBN2791107.1 gamma-glutamylcyclotransferase [Desulfuromonadales bacterium]
MLYFAYGSNMSVRRLRARVSSAAPLCSAVLDHHRLLFHKVGRDGSGKCDAFATGQPADQVFGIIYRLAEEDKNILDTIEGLGHGYAEKEVVVVTPEGQPMNVMLYVATHIDAALKPFHWYREHVLRGAQENALPTDYVHSIQSVESVSDPMNDRQAREMAIYTDNFSGV